MGYQRSLSLDEYIIPLFPFDLEEDEFIALFFIRDEFSKFTKYVKNVDEINELLFRFSKKYNIYISLSTCKKSDIGELRRDTKSMYRRACIGIDFDKKDFEGTGISNFKDFIRQFKDATGLSYHIIVDSGHGYHFYLCIEETKNIVEVTDITKRLSRIANADVKVGIQTQMLRLPHSYNFKEEKVMSVNAVAGINESRRFNRYSLEFIKKKLIQKEKIVSHRKKIKVNTTCSQQCTEGFTKDFVCVQNMLRRGVNTGERNLCLGRITNYFRDVLKYNEENTLKEILKWNQKCGHKKSDTEITSDFKRYWNNKEYKLLGCEPSSPSIK